MTSRISFDEYAMNLAFVASWRGTCARRQVGAVLVNRRNHILAIGYNGVASGVEHCRGSNPLCPGAQLPSGTGLDLCGAIHAEQNALLQCRDVYDIKTVYCTLSPCLHCVKLLMNTGAERIVFATPYAHIESEGLWVSSRAGRQWDYFDAFLPPVIGRAELV